MAGGGPVSDAPPVFALIGFGQVAGVFAPALRERGAEVLAYDLLLEGGGAARRLAERPGAGAVEFATLEAALERATVVLSTVTSASAVAAARASSAHLTPRHLYIDLNATTPEVKRAVAALVAGRGARFVEGALLGAVGVAGAGARILLGGPHREEAAALLNGCGLNAEPYHPEIGRASAFKLLRSVFSKGLEALLVEFLVAARRAGLEDELWGEVAGLFRRHPFEAVALEWVRSHGTAHERRRHEVADAAALVRALGVEPSMSEAAEAVFARSAALGLAGRLGGSPRDWRAVIEALSAAEADGGAAEEGER